jgi:hypothetical protein
LGQRAAAKALQAKAGNPARVKCVLGDDRLWRFQSHTLRPIFVGRDHPFSLTIDPDRLRARSG